MITSLPNLLTLSRIAAVPVLVAILFLAPPYGHWLALAVFVAAAVTDYLDGWLARTWQEQSAFGRMMDPIADKLLVASALMLLVAFDNIRDATIIAALVILCREFMVSGLREFLAGLSTAGLPVSRLAKWKTGIQMTAIGFLIVGDAAPWGIPARLVGDLGLWIAAVLTIVTGFAYLRLALAQLTPGRSGEAASRPSSHDDAHRAAAPEQVAPPDRVA